MLYSRKPLLTEDEEIALVNSAKNGDIDARNELVERNIRLVFFVANKYRQKSSLEITDLVQEGCLGLLKAVEKYELGEGTKFSTFATYWIRQTIVRAILNSSRLIRVPVYQMEIISKVKKIKSQLENKYGAKVQNELIAKELNLPVKAVKEALSTIPDAVSYDRITSEDEDFCLGDLIPDESVLDFSEYANQSMLKETLAKAMKTLTEREQQVLSLRYGLIGGHMMTLEEVGKKVGLSRERVRQLEKSALNKLRHPIRSKKLKPFL